MASVIDWIAEKKELEVYAFYEEVPIKVKIRLIEIDYEKEQMAWSFDKKLELALSQSKELYFEYEGTIYILNVIMYSREEMVTTFPSIAVEPKLKRRYIRVHVSEDKPIYVEFDNVSTVAWDISEKGIGLILDNIGDIELGKSYEIKIKIEGKEFLVKGEVVYIKEIGKKSIKVGIKFIKASPVLEDKIFKYILAKQKEILKKISLFRD